VTSEAAFVAWFAIQGALPSGILVFGGFSGEFYANGSYRIEGEGWPALVGTFTANGSELLLLSREGPGECTGPGRYAFEVEGGRLSLRLKTDDCVPRRMILDGSVWRPAGVTEAPPERRIQLRSAGKRHPLPEPGSASGSWPSFRGPGAAGVAEGQDLPDRWNGETGENLLWKAPIAGLAHSSPILWGDRVFVTSAVSSRAGASFRPGLYGDGDASDDRSSHQWVIQAIDKRTGATLWKRVAYEGIPADKRHVKSTYASATPATDGRVVVASFGSQGVHAYDVEGRFLWSLHLGRLNLGAYDIPTFEWGPASSPLVWGGVVFLQCDTQDDSFLLALDAASGETLWKTDRDELPSWGSPSVFEGPSGAELVTNSPNYIRGYDPRTGKELWRLGGSSKITAPTPVFADGLIVAASGRRPEQPIFVVRAGARGDLTLGEGRESSDAVVWSRTGRGPYMPTPLIYQGILYVLANNGVLDAYDLATGKEIYRQRIPHLGSGFSASPVAADGKIYLANEDGEVIVVKAGSEFGHIATNTMGELLMATPALSEGVLYVRAVSHLFAIGRRRGRSGPGEP
jgi:outer membrane protein assembly factor BamB